MSTAEESTAEETGPTCQTLVNEFDALMKEHLDGWPERWAKYKAEQDTMIQQLMVEATAEAEDGSSHCVFLDPRLEKILDQGDMRTVLQSQGFEVHGHRIDWTYATLGRAAELRAISEAQACIAEIRVLQNTVFDMIQSITPGPRKVYMHTATGRAALHEILKKYPILVLISTHSDHCVLGLTTEDRTTQ